MRGDRRAFVRGPGLPKKRKLSDCAEKGTYPTQKSEVFLVPLSNV